MSPGFLGVTNATQYAIGIRNDFQLNTIVLNYTIYIEETAFASIGGIFLTLSQSGIIESLLEYDNGERTKNFLTFAQLPRVDDIIVITEQIFIVARIPDNLFIGDVANFMFNLNTLIFGADFNAMPQTQDYDTLTFVTVTRLPGELHVIT